jgi:hypothetical protein
VTEVAAPEAPPRLFTAADRCDRCGAQAKTVALLVPGILLFCAHHTRAYRAGLEAAGAAIESEL